jgi:hypothetical protein
MTVTMVRFTVVLRVRFFKKTTLLSRVGGSDLAVLLRKVIFSKEVVLSCSGGGGFAAQVAIGPKSMDLVADEVDMKGPAPRPSSLIQNMKAQTTLIKYGSQHTHTLMVTTARSHRSALRTRYLAMCSRNMCTGSDCGMSGAYSLVKRNDVLQSSQYFFCECESHSIKQSW